MTKIERNKRINEYIGKYLTICEDLPADKVEIARPLIERIAFMLTSLEEMECDINKKGTVVEYQNGKNQKGLQINPALKLYQPLVKTLNAVFAQFVSIVTKGLPEEEKESKLDAFRYEE